MTHNDRSFHARGYSAPALMQMLEPRLLMSTATLRHGVLTVYGTNGPDDINIGASGRTLHVEFAQGATQSAFRAAAIERIRVFGLAGDDSITLEDDTGSYLPNVTSISIDAGRGDDVVYDNSLARPGNRGERVFINGGPGRDRLVGGAHTIGMNGGSGDDELFGGAAGAILYGGAGNDLVTASDFAPQGDFAKGFKDALLRTPDLHDAAGSVQLVGGPGDDVLVGDNLRQAGVVDTLTGGGGSDAFYGFGADVLADYEVGVDQMPNANQFNPPAAVTQTATLSLSVNSASGRMTVFPPQGLGDTGPNDRIAVTDNSGTVTMRGPTGQRFLLADLLNAAGYPVVRLYASAGFRLYVNGDRSPLRGEQMFGYEIQNGDAIGLRID